MHMTIFSIVTALTALIIPKLMRMFKYKLILVTSVIIAVISTGMMAYSNDIYVFYLLGAIRGFSTGLFSIVPLTIIINGWFHKHHGLATSIVFGFSGLAGAICSPIFSSCIEKFGWNTGYIIEAGIILFLCLPAIIYPFEISATKEGLSPLGYEDDVKVEKKLNKNNDRVYTTIALICFCIFALINTTVTGITQHLPSFAETMGYGILLGSSLLSSGMVGNVVSKLIIGTMSDKVGPVKSSITMIIMNTIGIILIIVSKEPRMLIIGSFLFGFVYSVGAVGIPLLTKYLFGIDNYARIFPIISFLSNIGTALSLSIVGYIYDFTSSYKIAFFIAIGINMICLALIMFIIKNKKDY